jgi:hypothetical protein
LPHGDSFEPGVAAITRWLGVHAKRGARVLVESPTLGERLSWRSKFEVLGGALERRLTHQDASYFRGGASRTGTVDALSDYLRTFAVEWIVGDGPEFRSAQSVVAPVAVFAGTRIFQTKFPVDRILRGGGQLRASENLIEVRRSTPDVSLVLSYHWHPALRCRPDCRVERQATDVDRVGFIRVPAPHPADVLVWNSYEGW